jgi:signal transduction histidine kinase
VEPSEIKGEEGPRALLRELGEMLVEPRGSEPAKQPSRTGVSVERTLRVAGLQATLLPVLAVPLLLLARPTVPIGDAGWVLALGGMAAVVAMGVILARNPHLPAFYLGAANVFTACVLAMLTWLTGGFGSPFPIFYPLLASSITPHRPRWRRLLIGWILVCIALPLLYDDPVTQGDVARILTFGGVSVATLLTMILLSSRMSRTEVGLLAETGRLQEEAEQRELLVSRVTHEVRTPLTSIKGYLEALNEGEAGRLEHAQRDLSAAALRNTVRLELLVSDLLLLTHVEAGQLALNPSAVDVRALLDHLAEDLGQLAEERSTTLVVEAPPGLTWKLDKARFEQAVINLIANAIKYSPDGSAVLIRAREFQGDLWVDVVDKGVGIPTDEIDRVGERFFRASTAGTAQGTGLGIAITKELVALHRGALEIQSEPGRGSVFRIRIPGDPEAGSVVESE